MDDLANRMDAGFDRVDGDIRGLRGEMERRFAGMEQRFDQRFSSLETTIRWFGGSLIVGLAGTIATVVVAGS